MRIRYQDINDIIYKRADDAEAPATDAAKENTDKKDSENAKESKKTTKTQKSETKTTKVKDKATTTVSVEPKPTDNADNVAAPPSNSTSTETIAPATNTTTTAQTTISDAPQPQQSSGDGYILEFEKEGGGLSHSNKVFYISVFAVIGVGIILVILFIYGLKRYKKKKDIKEMNRLSYVPPTRSIPTKNADKNGKSIIPAYLKADTSFQSSQSSSNNTSDNNTPVIQTPINSPAVDPMASNRLSYYSGVTNPSVANNRLSYYSGVTNPSVANNRLSYYSGVYNPAGSNRNSIYGNGIISNDGTVPLPDPTTNIEVPSYDNHLSPMMAYAQNCQTKITVDYNDVTENLNNNVYQNPNWPFSPIGTGYPNMLNGEIITTDPTDANLTTNDSDTINNTTNEISNEVITDANKGNILPPMVMEVNNAEDQGDGDITSVKSHENDNILNTPGNENGSYLNQTNYVPNIKPELGQSLSRVISPRIESLNMKSNQITEGHPEHALVMESNAPMKPDRKESLDNPSAAYDESTHQSYVPTVRDGNQSCNSYYTRDNSTALSNNQPIITKVVEPNDIAEPMVPEIIETMSSNPTNSIRQSIGGASENNLLGTVTPGRPVSFPSANQNRASGEFRPRPLSFHNTGQLPLPDSKIRTTPNLKERKRKSLLSEENPYFIKSAVPNIVDDDIEEDTEMMMNYQYKQ